MTEKERKHRMWIVIAFAAVYIFWGSTYMGIAVAVRDIPPMLMAGTRFFIAGLAVLAFCALTGRRVAVNRRDFIHLSIVGLLLLSWANVVLAWAEQYVASGLAALIVSIVPLWFLVLDRAILRGPQPSTRALIGLALGIVGVVVLLWPKIATVRFGGTNIELIAAISLLFSSGAWALGSVLSKKWRWNVDPFTATGWQMAVAGAVNLVFAAVLGDYGRANWTTPGMLAVAYLIVFGSWVGYTAYIWLLEHVSTSKVSTYAYVNPVVAVLLGWAFLGERVTGYLIAGAIIIVPAVALVTIAGVKTRPRPPAAPATLGKPGLPPVQQAD
jgi:drug/metabolite transporter (DMT)-like permease